MSGFENLVIDDAVSVPSGIFIRFGDAGQCAFFDAQRRSLVSSIPCSWVMEGLLEMVSRQESGKSPALNLSCMFHWNLFDQDAQLVMGKLENESLLDH